MQSRREFITSLSFLSLALIFDRCGNSISPIQVGLGEDPEKILKWDKEASPTLNRISPSILTAWLNAKDSQSSNFNDWSSWKDSGFLEELSAKGYRLHIVTWEDINTTGGEYHIGKGFQRDMKELANLLKSHDVSSPLFSLATEFSTYLEPWDTYNRSYHDAFIKSIMGAKETIKSTLPKAEISISWGGWITTFDEPTQMKGRSMVSQFGDLMKGMDFVSFQSMRNYKTGEWNPETNSADIGNPAQILMCLKFFRQWHNRFMVSHYAPHNKRTDVLADDMWRMSAISWQRKARELGLFALNHMWYGIFKENKFDCLDAAENFSQVSSAVIKV